MAGTTVTVTSAVTGPNDEAEGLARLAEKYRTLGELRRAKARGEAPPERAFFRTLAQEFPGALRELDTLPLGELDARAEALGRASVGEPGALAPWMLWLRDYHAWMRAALLVKVRTARDVAAACEAADELAGAMATKTGLPLDGAFVRAAARPAAGRLRPMVLARVAELHGTDVASLAAVLVPKMAPR